MYIFNLSKLRAGDILLINTSERYSAIMQKYADSPYHHAMLYVGGSSLIHSNKGPGVQADNPMRMYFEKADAAIALRPKSSVDLPLIQAAIDQARNKVGTEYSVEEAQRTIKEKKEEEYEPNRQFCTRFVAQIYANVGLQIVENADYCTPKDLENSKYFDVIADILKDADEEELAYAMEPVTGLSKQIDINNEILSKARALSGLDLQTFNQLSDYMEDHPEKDKEISVILEESGFLEMWKWEREKNPCHYEYKSFTTTYKKSDRRVAGIQLLELAGDLEYRYSVNLLSYTKLYEQTRLRFFKLLVGLYQNLMLQVQDMKRVGNAAKNSI